MATAPVLGQQAEFAHEFWGSVSQGRNVTQALGDVQTRLDQAGHGGTAARHEFETKVLNAPADSLKEVAAEQLTQIKADRAQHPDEPLRNKLSELTWTNVQNGESLGTAIQHAEKTMGMSVGALGIDPSRSNFGKQMVAQTDNAITPVAQAAGFQNTGEYLQATRAGLNASEKHALDDWARDLTLSQPAQDGRTSGFRDMNDYARAQGWEGGIGNTTHQYGTVQGFLPAVAQTFGYSDFHQMAKQVVAEKQEATKEGFHSIQEMKLSHDAGLTAQEKHRLDQWAQNVKLDKPAQDGRTSGFKNLEDYARAQHWSSIADNQTQWHNGKTNQTTVGFGAAVASNFGHGDIHQMAATLPAAPELPRPPATTPTTLAKQSVEPPAALTTAEIKQIQKAAGMDAAHQTGKWDAATNTAVQNTILKAQLTDTYAHSGSHVEGIPGTNTMKGFDDLVKSGKMKAEDAQVLKDIGAARIRTSYQAPQGQALEAAVHDANKPKAFVPPTVASVIPKMPKVEEPVPPPIDMAAMTMPTMPNLGSLGIGGIPPMVLPAKPNGKGYRQGLMPTIADDGRRTTTQTWTADGATNTVVTHGDKHNKEVNAMSKNNSNGMTEVTHSEGGKMQWMVITDAKGNVVSDMERNAKGQLVETNPDALATEAKAQQHKKHSKNAGPSNS